MAPRLLDQGNECVVVQCELAALEMPCAAKKSRTKYKGNQTTNLCDLALEGGELMFEGQQPPQLHRLSYFVLLCHLRQFA